MRLDAGYPTEVRCGALAQRVQLPKLCADTNERVSELKTQDFLKGAWAGDKACTAGVLQQEQAGR